MAQELYDVVIIGGGPAGITAGLYAGRSLLKTLIIERMQYGGQAVMTHAIDNYPGAEPDDTGTTLIERMQKQAEHFGVELVNDDIIEVKLRGDVKTLKSNKHTYNAKTVIIASGAYPRLLGCKGEREYTGKGVSYCATCDAAFTTGLDVYVVGGGDSAVQEALFIARYAKKITFIQNLPALTAVKSMQSKVLGNPKFGFIYNTVVEEVGGTDDMLDKIILKDVKTGELRELKADPADGTFSLFVFIGLIPRTALFEGVVNMDGGYIVTDGNMRTNIPGVYAAGDCRAKTLRQIVTATSDGAIAAMDAERYLDS